MRNYCLRTFAAFRSRPNAALVAILSIAWRIKVTPAGSARPSKTSNGKPLLTASAPVELRLHGPATVPGSPPKAVVNRLTKLALNEYVERPDRQGACGGMIPFRAVQSYVRPIDAGM